MLFSSSPTRSFCGWQRAVLGVMSPPPLRERAWYNCQYAPAENAGEMMVGIHLPFSAGIVQCQYALAGKQRDGG